MRKKVILLSLFLACGLLAFTFVQENVPEVRLNTNPNTPQTASEWSEAVNISRSGADSSRGRVAGDGLGRAYAIWSEVGGGKRVYFNTNKSGNWLNSEAIPHTGVTRFGEGPWPAINVDANNNPVVTYTAVTDGNYEIVYNRWRNNSWDGNENVSRTAAAGSVSSTIIVDPRSNDYFVVWQDDIDRPPPPPEVSYWLGYVRYKSGGAGSWVGAGAIKDPGSRAYSHHAAMNANGKAFVVWVNRVMGNISRVFYSENVDPKQNSGWTTAVDISNLTGMLWAEPKVACDDNGNAFVVWQDGRAGNTEIFFSKKVNGKWGDVENISQTGTVSELPTIAAHPTDGTIYVAWQENTAAAGWEIFLREYSNGTWKDTVNMSNTSPSSAQPNLMVDVLGGVHLVFSDRRDGPWDVYYRNKPGIMPVYPPQKVTLATTLDEEGTTKTNTVTWEENVKNSEVEEFFYTLYRKEAGQTNLRYERIATIEHPTLTYDDAGLPLNKKYWYRMQAISDLGLESENTSNAVTENYMWPISNLHMSTGINRYLFFQEKINTLSWEANPLNGVITIDKLVVYRKPGDADDSAMELLDVLDANASVYVDRYLPLDEEYGYMVKVVDIYGQESSPNVVIVEP